MTVGDDGEAVGLLVQFLVVMGSLPHRSMVSSAVWGSCGRVSSHVCCRGAADVHPQYKLLPGITFKLPIYCSCLLLLFLMLVSLQPSLRLRHHLPGGLHTFI